MAGRVAGGAPSNNDHRRPRNFRRIVARGLEDHRPGQRGGQTRWSSVAQAFRSPPVVERAVWPLPDLGNRVRRERTVVTVPSSVVVMSNPSPSRSKLRRKIAWDAARLIYDRSETEYYQAKIKAARRVARGWVKPADLPRNVEIRDQVHALSRLYEGDARQQNLTDMRFEALHVMRLLERFRPRLVGSVLTGHIRAGSDIDLHVFSDSVDAVTRLLDAEGVPYDVERKQIRKHGMARVYTHLHLRQRFPIELTVYAADQAHIVPRCSITGGAMQRATRAELEALLATAHSRAEFDEKSAQSTHRVDRFQVYESLLLPLENVRQPQKYHPEGDALYHSLQVFVLARDAAAYDEEFLLAALLHDVGKAIDPADHTAAGLEALHGFITERTAWLIEKHMEGHALLEGALGVRARRRLKASENFEDLLLLARCDRDGRQPGMEVPEVGDALDSIRQLALMFE